MLAVYETKGRGEEKMLTGRMEREPARGKDIVGEARDKEKSRGEDPCWKSRCCEGDHANKARVTVKGNPCTCGTGL